MISVPKTIEQMGGILNWPGIIATAQTPKVITANGDVSQISPYAGAGLGCFDGSGDRLTIPGTGGVFNLTGDFCIEFDVTMYGSTSRSYFEIGNAGGSSGFKIVSVISGAVYGYVNGDSTAAGSASLTKGRSYHLCGERRSGITYFYVDGVQFGTRTSSGGIDTGNLGVIVGDNTTLEQPLNGYITNIRVSNCQRYGGNNFKPPKKQHVVDSNTVLLMRCLGSGGSFVDSSPNGHVITTVGNATQIQSPGGIIRCDGTGDYLSVPDSDDWSLFAENFTLRIGTYFSSVAADRPLFGQYDTSSNYWYLMWIQSTNKLQLIGVLGGTENFNYSCSFTPSVGSQYYIEVCKSGSSCLMFINGVSQSVTEDQAWQNTTDVAAVLTIGRSNTAYQFGHFFEIEVAKGIARHTSNYTPLTSQIKPDQYTKLLISGVGQFQSFSDVYLPPVTAGFPVLPPGKAITLYGSFAVKKLKTGELSLYFDGSTNGISIPIDATWMTDRCTWYLWLKPKSGQSGMYLIQMGASNDACNALVITGDLTGLHWYSNNSGLFASCVASYSWTADVWHLLSFTRDGSVQKIAVDCVELTKSTDTYGSVVNSFSSPVIRIGNNIGGSTGYYAKGQMRHVTIIPGRALTKEELMEVMRETYIN